MNLRQVLDRPEYKRQSILTFEDRIVFAELQTTSKDMYGEFTKTAAGILVPVPQTQYHLGVVVATGYNIPEGDMSMVQVGDLIYYSPFSAGRLEREVPTRDGKSEIEIIETGSITFNGHKYFTMRESQVLGRHTLNGITLFRDNIMVKPDPMEDQIGSILLSEEAIKNSDRPRTGVVRGVSGKYEGQPLSTGDTLLYSYMAGDPVEVYFPGKEPEQMLILQESEVIGIME